MCIISILALSLLKLYFELVYNIVNKTLFDVDNVLRFL